MEHNRRPQQQRTPSPSPRMFRSKSSTSPGTRQEPKPSQSQLVGRSNSSRTTATTTNTCLSNSRLMTQRSPSHYSSISSNVNTTKTNSNNKAAASSGRSKSAWALSPGRSFAPPPPDHSRIKKTTTVVAETKCTNTVRGGVSGVLKYFKSKKASSKEQEDFHNCKMLHNRLVQWRFTNAKAQASMASAKIQAENKLFSVWLEITKVRNMIMEKRIWVRKHQHKTKFLEIVNPQIGLLEEWVIMEKRNFEALSRMTRKLCAISVQLPLVNEAEGDVETVYDSLRTAMNIMENFEEYIPKLFHQVEVTYSLLEELIITAEQQRECVEELSLLIATVSSLEVSERSSKVCLIQSIEETMYLLEFVI